MGDPFIMVKDNVIDKIVCKEIINKFESQINKYYGVTVSGKVSNTKNSIDYTLPENIEDPDFKSWLPYRKMLSSIIEYEIQNYINSLDKYNDDKFFTNRCSDGLTFKTFLIHKFIKKTGYFNCHSDDAISVSDKESRIFVYIFYLNDIDKGGETEFYNGIKTKSKTRRLMIFPASFTYPHKGIMPISDDKYILTGWVYTPLHNSYT